MAGQGTRQTDRGRERQAPRPRPRRQGAPLLTFRLTGPLGVLVLVAITAVGALLDGIAGGPPGVILYLSLIVGTAVAAILLEDDKAWLLLPAPALVFPVMALAAGLIGDKHAHGKTGIASSLATYMLWGFPSMAVATLVAASVALFRLLAARRA